MAANFTVTPHLVTIESKEYNIIETQSEDMKKEYYKLSDTPTVRYRLHFKAVSSSTMGTILAHYDSAFGSYDSFSWTSVPSYIEAGASLTGRWVNDSIKISEVGMKFWNVQILFEKAI